MNTVAELTGIGFDATLAQHVLDYVERLNGSDAIGPGKNHKGGRYMSFSVDSKATRANKYVRIIGDTGGPYGKSVHAFIVKATGQVVKPAGYKAPAKSTAAGKVGEFLSNYTLTDDDSRAKLWNLLATDAGCFAGGYLYQR